MQRGSPEVLPQVDASIFRAAMGQFPTGVALLTHGSGADTHVITVNCLVSVSLDPLLLLVGVKERGRMRERISSGGSFAVNVLTAGQRDLSMLFARADRPVGAEAARRLGAVTGGTGNAVLPSALVVFECETHTEYPAGDHALFLGRVVAIHCGDTDRAPLVFHRSRYAGIA